MKKIIKCLNCGKEMEVYPSSKRKFCSIACRAQYQSKKVKYKNFTCEYCGKSFKRTERYVRMQQNKNIPIRFCSMKCKQKYWGRNRIKTVCPVCGKTFLIQKKDYSPNRCCSPECSAKNPKNKLLQGNMMKLICKECGRSFSVKESYYRKQVKRGQPVNFCSRKCSNDYRRKYERILYTCDYCGKSFEVPQNDHKHHFCSEQCRISWMERNSQVLKCQFCGKEFTENQYDVEHGRKYCSEKCWNAARHKEKTTYAKLQHYLRSTKEYQIWRKEVLRRAHWRCEKCGSKDRLNVHHSKITLYNICKQYNFDIDSIIHSKVFNDVQNGQCLCLECHIKEHPYHKELRNKKGQFCRREFKTAKKLTTKRTELSGETVEKPQSEPKAPRNELDS